MKLLISARLGFIYIYGIRAEEDARKLPSLTLVMLLYLSPWRTFERCIHTKHPR